MPLTVNIRRNSTDAQVLGPCGELGKRSQKLHEKCPQNRLEEGRFQALHCLGGTHHVAGCELLQSEGLGSTEAVFRSGSIYIFCRDEFPVLARCRLASEKKRANLPTFALESFFPQGSPPIPLTMSSLLVKVVPSWFEPPVL